jgi:hypothetical protein
VEGRSREEPLKMSVEGGEVGEELAALWNYRFLLTD